MREHLEAYEQHTGMKHPQLLDAPELPGGLEMLWADFVDLHISRGSTGLGPARITYLDIDAFQRVRNVRLLSWQIDAIQRADTEYMRVAMRRGK